MDYSVITDEQLDLIASQFVLNHPCCGEKSFEGYLRHMGLRVQRWYIRSSLQRVDSRTNDPPLVFCISFRQI